jgi:hypothetical protein
MSSGTDGEMLSQSMLHRCLNKVRKQQNITKWKFSITMEQHKTDVSSEKKAEVSGPHELVSSKKRLKFVDPMN